MQEQPREPTWAPEGQRQSINLALTRTHSVRVQVLVFRVQILGFRLGSEFRFEAKGLGFGVQLGLRAWGSEYSGYDILYGPESEP